MRVQEAFRLRYSDVKEKSDGIWITFKRLKTRGRSDQVSQELYISNNTYTNFAAPVYENLSLVQKLRMSNTGGLWCGYDSCGNCLPKTCGYNRFQAIGRYWAEFLGYGEEDFYFHSFRRTTCTIAVEIGATSEQLKGFLWVEKCQYGSGISV